MNIHVNQTISHCKCKSDDVGNRSSDFRDTVAADEVDVRQYSVKDLMDVVDDIVLRGRPIGQCSQCTYGRLASE